MSSLRLLASRTHFASRSALFAGARTGAPSASLVPQRAESSGPPAFLRRWLFNASGFNQYGLYHNDCLYENEYVVEAVRRLSPQAQDERAFRIQRAMQLSMKKVVLPQDQWISFEEDQQKGRYLRALIAEVKAEHAERKVWDAKV